MDIATRYDGPIAVARLAFAGVEVSLARPGDPDRLLNDPGVHELNRRDDYMPYWAYLWPGAYLLAQAVAVEPWEAGAEALELGCGLGLAGLVALRRGLVVHFSDYDPAPFGFVERSLRASGLAGAPHHFRILDWRDPPEERFPVILGADLLYERRLVPLVAGVLGRLLAPGGLALLAGPYRVASEGFPAEAAARGLAVEARPASARDERGEPVRGTLWRVRHAITSP